MKIMKVLSIVLAIAMVMAMGTTSVFAADIKTPNEISANINGTVQNEIGRIGGNIMGTIQIVGIVVAVIILMVIGIKYMMGSAEEKAEYKKTMVPYIVGAIVLFAASTLANMAYNIAIGIKG